MEEFHAVLNFNEERGRLGHLKPMRLYFLLLLTLTTQLVEAQSCGPGPITDISNLLTPINRDDNNRLARVEPPDLIEVPREPIFSIPEGRTIRLRRSVVRALRNMLTAAYQEDESLRFRLTSGYRDFDHQCRLYRTILQSHGHSNGRWRVAYGGHSEHQLGTAVDMMVAGWSWTLPNPPNENPPTIQWLIHNAHRFGFAMSYPRDPNSGSVRNQVTTYLFEPWHWRYIGVQAATELYEVQLEEDRSRPTGSSFPFISTDEYISETR